MSGCLISSRPIHTQFTHAAYGSSNRTQEEHSNLADEEITKPEITYKDIVKRAIELLWGQQDHILEIKIRERRIREKTKTNLRKLYNIVQDTDELIRQQLDLQAERYWAMKKDYKLPLKSEVIQHFNSNWNKIYKLLDTELNKITGVTTECGEIRDLINKAVEELPVRYEDIKKLQRMFEKRALQMRNCPTSTTVDRDVTEMKLSLRSLRRNDTLRGSIQ